MKTEIPEISIIVPVYRVEPYLNRCIKSILNQTFTNFELILVDDGSPDHCPCMCDEWAGRDHRICVLHKENGGLSSARNAGLAIARGNYIGFVDSDDWIATDMYEHLYRLICTNKADISCGYIKRVQNEIEQGENGNISTAIYCQDEFAKKFFKIDSNETIHYVVNKLYKREIALKMNFPEGLINEDVEGFFRALVEMNRIVVSNKTVYYYWENPESISYQWFSYKQMDLLTVWEHVCDICQKQKIEWLEYAKINYYRANLGLLSRLALNDMKEERKFEREKRFLLENLKKYKKELLRAPIPLSRKIALQMMCINYNLSKSILCFIHKRINIVL